MRTFRDLVDDDRTSVFLDPDTFAEQLDVEGCSVFGVLDGDTHAQKFPEIGLASSEVTLFADASSLPERREAGDTLVVNGRIYLIDSWQEEMGMATIAMTQQRAGY